ncbi:hypothetical protein Q8F55_001198 [Vanrija albida]|uniref:Uncharacterized protein n=1 Tax=Vanrija albida TaxID=181172 RepID=A0ABR3QGG0_9TREE
MSFGFDAPTPNVANALDFDSPSLQRILRGSGSVASDAFSPGASPLLPRRISRFAPISSDPPAPPAFTAPVSTAAVAADADRSNSFDAEEDTVIARQSPALSTRARSPAPEVDGEEEEDPPAAVAQETLEEDEEPEEEEEYDNLPVARSPSPGYSPSPGPEDDMDLEGDTVIIADESTEADEILPAETEVDVTVAHPPAREASPAVAVVAEQSLTVPPTATSSRARTEPPASSSPFVSRTGFRFFSPAASSVHEGLDEELDATPSESEKDSSPGPSTAAPAAPVREDRVVPQNDEEPHTDVLGDASAVEEPSLDVDTDADAVAVDEESFEADATAHTAEVGSGAADDHTADAEDDPYEDAEEAEVDQPTSSPRWSASTHRSSIADVLAPAHLIVSSTPEPNTSNTSSNDEAGPTTPSSSSIEVEASSPMAEDTEPSPEPGPISPVRNSVHTFSGTPRATVPEIDKQGFVPSSPMSPTNLSPALSSRLSSGLTLNFGAVAVGSPSRAPRLASPALNSRSSAVADEEREVNEPPVAPGNERSETSLEAPFEEEDTVEVPFEEGDTLEAPFEEGDTLDAPFEEDDTDEALPEGDTLDAPFEEGDTLDAPFDEEDSGEVPQDDSTTESAQPEAPAHVLDAFVVEEAPVHAGQREGQQPISTNEDAEVAQAPTTTQVPATESQGDSLLGKSTDEAIEPAESRHQHASAVHLEPEPTSPTVEPEVKVPSANASPVAHRQPSAPPTPVRKPVTAPLQQTPVTSSRPSSQSPAVAARSPYASTVSIARTLIFSEVSRSAAPRPPLVDYDSDSEDDLGANDTVEGITEAWDVTAADVRFDADATRAIRFEDAEIDDSRLDWNITAIAPVLGAAAAAWTSPRVTSPSLPALASPSRSLASRSPQTRPRTSNPIVPPSPAQSSRAPSVLPAGSPALCAREPSFLAPQSPARGTRVRSPLVAQSPARALSQPRVHSPALRSSVASSSVDLDEEAHRTLRHDAPPPSDGILPTSSPAKPVSVHPDEGVDEDEAEESADATVIANGHRDGEYAQEASRQVYGRHIAQHDDEADEEHPDGAEDNTNDHLDHGDGDDEMGDEDEGLDDESDNENEVEARDAPDEDDGRIVLALVSRGIVKVEPNEERDAPVKETRGALPVVESPAQQPPALQFPARIGIPSPFVLAAARSRASSSSQAAGPSQLAHEPSPAAGPSNGPLPSNTSSLANGSPVEDASSEPGPSNRRPPARAEVPAPAPPAPAPPPPPPAATSWRASRPRIPSALAQEISTRSATPSAQPSPVRSLHDELETAAAEHESVAESDESDSVSEPFNSVVDITSRDPYAAARAAAILKVNYEYVEHGILPDGTPGPITRPLQRTAEEIAEDIANRSMPDGTLDMASLVYDAELDLSYRADWSRSPSCFSSRAPDSPLPIPGGWGNRSSTKRKREGGHQSTARKKRHHDALLFTRKDWSTLNTVYRSERRKWIQECDGGARHEWDESRVVDAFIEKQQLAESDLVGRWSRDLLADYTTALGRRLTGNDKAGPRQPEASGADEEPEASRAELVPPSTIKRVIDWVWGVGTGRKRGSGGVVKRVQTPYVGNAAHAASPSDNPYDHDDSHATINYSRSRRSVSVQIPDGAGGLQLRTLDETFDIGDVTMAQTPSRPATRGLRPLEVASRAPAILEEEESESADEAEEAEESVRGDGDSAHGDHDFAPEEEDQRPKRPRRKYWQPASREYRYGAGDADNSRPLFAPVYPSLPDRSAAYTSVVSGTPRPLVKVRSGPADAIPFPLGGPSRSALPSNSTPNVLNIVRGFEASRQLDLSYESRRREKEKATVSGLRRVSSRVESLEESFERSGEGSSFERSVERSRE